MNYFVIIAIAWLAPDGHISAYNTGSAVDVRHCQAIAEKNIAEQQNKPDMKGLKPIISCWDTREIRKPGPAKLAPNEREL